MANIYGVPEIGVHEVAQKRAKGEAFVLLDVREKIELTLANLGDDVVWVPLSQLAAKQQAALPGEIEDKDTPIVVFCHTGRRSAQVAAWLRNLGWQNVMNMIGGIDEYARQIDPSIGFY